MTTYYLAIDIGASSGRHILGWLKDGKIQLEEIYRFKNGVQEKNGHLCWNSEYLFQQILTGMKRCKEMNKIPQVVGIDTWGVDFRLLNSEGKELGDFISYRDQRTTHMPEQVQKLVSQRELYETTGIQTQSYNTIYQLMAIKKTQPELLEQADCMLMTPDYLNYLLTGEKQQEYTMATTTQLLNLHTGEWDWELIRTLGLPEHIFLPLKRPGTVLGKLTDIIQKEVGYQCDVVMSASHDTASAVVAVPCLEEKMLYISSGTWSLMGVETTSPMCGVDSMNAGLSNEGGYDFHYTVLKNIMGLWMIQSVKRELGENISFGEICEMASKETITSIVDCEHEMFLSPVSMVTAIRDYCASTRQEAPDTLSEIAAVIYNSLAKDYARTKEQIEQLTGCTYDKIYIVGGGCQAEYLNQLTCKYTGCDIYAGPVEATAIGNLLVQMMARSEIMDLTAAREVVVQSFQPARIDK